MPPLATLIALLKQHGMMAAAERVAENPRPFDLARCIAAWRHYTATGRYLA